ncbi:hypothetical protein NJH83_22240 [Pseudomonas chlororaphis]|nr:hypothetical protein [Pseudomonas chlororaphis]MCO7612956.1 hypothetical protein [Pseudomonas chlororaphis]
MGVSSWFLTGNKKGALQGAFGFFSSTVSDRVLSITDGSTRTSDHGPGYEVDGDEGGSRGGKNSWRILPRGPSA